MAIMVNDNNICDLPKWVPVTTDHSTTLIINLAVAGSNVPLGIFAFLSNLAITVTALQRPSSIFLCSFTTSDCVVGLVAQPLFFTWWMFIQRAQDYWMSLSATSDLSCLDIQDVSYWIVVVQHNSNQPGSLLCILPSFILPGKSHMKRRCIIFACDQF